MSPEVLRKQKYNLPTDIFSFAITMYEMFGWCDCYPKQKFEFEWDITDFVVPGGRRPQAENMTDDEYDLITKCWNDDPSERLTIDEIIPKLNTLSSVAMEECYI